MDTTIGLITTNYACEDLAELTRERPPAALPFNGRYRLVDFVLSNMVNVGIKTLGVVLPTAYRALVDHLGSGKDWMLDRKHQGLFLLPGSPYGRVYGGPRFLLRDLIENHVFLDREQGTNLIVAAPNIIYSMDYAELIEAHVASDADITLLTTESLRSNTHLMGVSTNSEGRIVEMHQGVDKGETAFMDCFIVKTDYLRKLLTLYKNVDYLGLFEALAGDFNQIDLRTYSYTGSALSIFSTADYYEGSLRVLDTDIINLLFDYQRPIYTKSHDNPPVKYTGDASVKRSMVSEGSRIEGTVEHSVLGRKVRVKKDAVVKDSIIMQGCVVEEGAVVRNAILDRNNVVPAHTKLVGTAKDVLIQEKVQAI